MVHREPGDCPQADVRSLKELVEPAAVAVLCGDVEGSWRREALPQPVRGQLEYQGLCVYPVGPLELLHRLQGHAFDVFCVAAYRSDGGTGGADKSVKRWSAVSGAVVDVLSGQATVAG